MRLEGRAITSRSTLCVECSVQTLGRAAIVRIRRRTWNENAGVRHVQRV